MSPDEQNELVEKAEKSFEGMLALVDEQLSEVVDASDIELPTLREKQADYLEERILLRESVTHEPLLDRAYPWVLGELRRAVAKRRYGDGGDLGVRFLYGDGERGLSREGGDDGRDVTFRFPNPYLIEHWHLFDVLSFLDFAAALSEKLAPHFEERGYHCSHTWEGESAYKLSITWDSIEFWRTASKFDDISQVDAFRAGVPVEDIFA